MFVFLVCLQGIALCSASTLNTYQWIGSHNSYKRPVAPAILTFVAKHNVRHAKQIDYSHPTLTTQLELGLRQLEIDVVHDPKGAHYAKPSGELLIKRTLLTPSERNRLMLPGFKVQHLPHIDFLSHCIALMECIDELNAWSNKNPQHFPVIILVNAKESQRPYVEGNQPIPFDQKAYRELDLAWQTGFQDKLITPDDIRQEAQTLNHAINTEGWPNVEALRGKFIVLFDGNHTQRNLYRQSAPSLTGRAMFASYAAGEPEAAIMIINNPIAQQAQIKQAVKQGYLVRTRADADFSASNQQRAAQLEAAIASGAQIISTDFYPHSPQALTSGYSVTLGNGSLIRGPVILQQQTLF